MNTLYYAACEDCPQYGWAEDESDAKKSAQAHANERDHDAYWGTIEVGE